MTKDMYDWEERRGWERKVWGDVQHVFNSPDVAVSVLKVKAGFRCSRHLHRFRSNQFDVVSGRIEVWEWADEGDMALSPNHPIYKFDLGPGKQIRIGAGKPHMFRVIEDGIVVEIYTSSNGQVDIDDIVRFDEGGET